LKVGISEARPIAVVLLIICLWVFILLQFGKTFLPGRARR
jgi:VanZ family protein